MTAPPSPPPSHCIRKRTTEACHIVLTLDQLAIHRQGYELEFCIPMYIMF